MDFQIEKCILALQHLSAPQVQKILQCKYSLTYVLLDLQLLENEINKTGEETTATSNLSGEELVQLSKFASAKRKREWLGGRFAAKYAAARLLEQVKSQNNDMTWFGYVIMADKNGRPFLSTNKGNPANTCDISISHSASMAAAMAVNKGYCGVDIQKVTPQVIKVSSRFCTNKEKKILLDFFPVESEKQAAPLTKLWAAKEALRKASFLDSLPGFLELELIEITAAPLQKNADLWGFIFKWKNPAGSTHEICRVAVSPVEDYVLALTARDDTVD
ncbi:4'-phosphopantetheinyl transferase superfamily protein [Thermodesulfobacteriota bacterium]